jgi:nicotinamidase-related amidase
MTDCTQPDLARSALLTIDVQNDFTMPGAPAEIAGTYQLLPIFYVIAQAYRRANLPIIHVVRLYLPDGSNAELCRRNFLSSGTSLVCPGTDGAELVDALKPTLTIQLDPDRLLKKHLQPIAENEWIMYKPRWGAFYKTPLEDHLAKLALTSLTVIGCNYPNCPRTTIYEASERDFRICLVEDAVSGLDERGCQEMDNIGVHVLSNEEVLTQLSQLVVDFI